MAASNLKELKEHPAPRLGTLARSTTLTLIWRVQNYKSMQKQLPLRRSLMPSGPYLTYLWGPGKTTLNLAALTSS